jgi:hypothetical protein
MVASFEDVLKVVFTWLREQLDLSFPNSIKKLMDRYRQVAEAGEVLHRNMVLSEGQFTFHTLNKRIRINCFYFLNLKYFIQKFMYLFQKFMIKKYGDDLHVRTQFIVKHVTV